MGTLWQDVLAGVGSGNQLGSGKLSFIHLVTLTLDAISFGSASKLGIPTTTNHREHHQIDRETEEPRLGTILARFRNGGGGVNPQLRSR